MNKVELLKQLGECIAKYRLKKGLSQTQLANILEIDRGNLTRIEKGRSNVTAETLLKISEALDTPIADFFKFQK